MDGLSTTVNVLSALDLSVKGLGFLVRYYSGVKEAQASLDQLREYLTQELHALQEVLTLYERLSTQTELSPHTLQSIATLEKLLQEDSNGFYADLQEFIQWLQKYTAKSDAKPLQRISRFFKPKRTQGNTAPEEGRLTLSQKLRCSIKGKKKVKNIMAKIHSHRAHLCAALQHVQLYVSLFQK